MALIKKVKGVAPTFGKDVFLADNATIIGDVIIGDECTIWFNAVVRGDVHSIRIGNKTNIQDGAIIHCTYQKASTTIGSNVSIGHGAMIHGCTLEDGCLVGMGAIVMDNAVVQTGALVAAGAVVLENTICETGYIYAGTPAKKVKAISEELGAIFERTANNYVMYSKWIED
ncbi:gamma carbonic anhydrase family protein [Flammeovirgaceae bacterium SG7u.111]|nr:gamma carbonic anhydrase family protein [Flammeovirgaceae bacterium SG7u.132]WPO33220.1 gamma carbonic anhydrase family protein [Flammeovirgaceae bacterium SG7u.111]